MLHGSLYEYLRNTDLNARPHGSAVTPPTHQNEFGVTIGGPIVVPHVYDGHNRSFFFFSFGGSRKSGVDSLQLLTVPSTAELGGDFSGGATVYDPQTTRLDPTGTRYIRDPFPGNKIPSYRLDAVGKAIAAYYPQVAKGGANNYSAYAGEKLLNPDIYTFKIDHQFAVAHRLSLTLVTNNIPRFRVDSALPAPLTAGILQTAITKTARVNYDWIISANKLNSIAVGYNRFVDSQPPPSEDTDQIPKLGLGGIGGGTFPAITFTNGYATAGVNTAQRSVDNSFQMKDTFSWAFASHSLRLGGEFRRTQLNDIVPGVTQGTLGFSNKETADPNSLSNTGDAIASLLLGQVDTGGIQEPFEIATRRSYGGLFAQDDWKATHRLTLNVGVRWEYQTVPSEVANRSSMISLTTPNPTAGNIPGALIFAGTGPRRSGQSTFAPNDFSAVSGRVGFAYQATPSTVLRAGYGLFYSDNELTIVGTGFLPQASFTTTNNGVTPAFVLQSGYPQNGSLQPTLSPGLINGQAGTYYQPNVAALPRLQEWTAGVQQSLGKKWLFEMDYIGNHGSRLVDPQMANINQVNPAYLSLGSLLTQQASSAAAQAAGIKLPYSGFSGTVAQALRPFPQYQTLTAQSAKAGASIYNAMQVMLRRQFGSNLTLNINYTYSKNMGYSSPTYEGFDSVDNVLQNAYNPAAEWSVLPSDVRHALVLNYIYALPFGHGQQFLNRGRFINAVAGGWSLTGVHRYQSGFPLSILTNNTLPIFNRVLRPSKVAGVDAATHVSAGGYIPGVSRRINPAAFAQPAAFTFGNAAPSYGDLTSFPVFTEDLAAVKRFQVGDHLGWELYGQFFNAFNHHRYTLIDTNLSDAGFGQASSVSQPRYIQLGARMQF
ncbi:TonB-dependent receptor domain-containing protein [Edaphobacter aggregans]|uniref:TonB-dependent receptor domain-containing protein n=1 Tax=Edaphobacter aggregans TaxID=570835 RepID=UPI0005524235|nr:TonB-dependent receptor [Edaphobacter aggregans]